jgi:hypothetical protein
VLEGSVRKAGGRVRITAQLIDALSGTHLWADRFDGSLEDVFDLRDKVAISAVGVIEPTLQAAEIRRSADSPTNDLTAYDLYLRALSHGASFEKSRIAHALDLLERAIELDPRYGSALALAGFAATSSTSTAGPTTGRRTGAPASILRGGHFKSPLMTPTSLPLLRSYSAISAKTSVWPSD